MRAFAFQAVGIGQRPAPGGAGLQDPKTLMFLGFALGRWVQVTLVYKRKAHAEHSANFASRKHVECRLQWESALNVLLARLRCLPLVKYEIRLSILDVHGWGGL